MTYHFRSVGSRFAASVLSLLFACVVVGQEEDEDLFARGLIGRYSNAKGESFERQDAAVSFSWMKHPPDRRLAAGPFQASWRGFLLSQSNGTYQLHAYFSGKLRLTLNDKVLVDSSAEKPRWFSSQPIPLDYDYHRLAVAFEKTNDLACLSLFWTGPGFQLEPIDGRQLFHHRAETPDGAFERGEALVRALRCEACHQIGGDVQPLAAPSLQHLSGNLERDWLVRWLAAKSEPEDLSTVYPARRMPHFGLDTTQAEEIASWLMAKSQPVTLPAPVPKKNDPSPAKTKSKKKKEETDLPVKKTPVEAGRELFLTVGCLGCHQLGELGSRGPFDGGDLTTIAAKRPPKFFESWLSAPASLNERHRMPVFELSDAERSQLSVFLTSLGSPTRTQKPSPLPAAVERGEKAVATFRCAACHALPGEKNRPQLTKSSLKTRSDWRRSCVGEPSRPGQPRFALADADRNAIQTFVSRASQSPPSAPPGRRLLVENNCLECHQRNESPGIAPRLTRVGSQHPQIAELIPSMTPPPLNSVGDKLHDKALRSAIARQGSSHRPYLLVRMPRFAFTDSELQALLDYFISADRIPDGSLTTTSHRLSIEPGLLEAVGSRLVTPDGFGCTSCHQVGQVMPVKAPLNARGPDLSLLGQRVRREWYDRWVRNPARIVPRMEMPSVQVAVRGVLRDNLDDQLAAVWDVLNKPGFQPPLPNPIRVVRHTGTRPDERATVVTDVVRLSNQTFIKPVLIGMSNRHNVLFDSETARLIDWSIGDTARQRTEGKSWYWEAAGNQVLRPELERPEISLQRNAKYDVPEVVGQFVADLDEVEHLGNGIRLRYRLQFSGASHRVLVTQTYTPIRESGRSGFRRRLELAQLPSEGTIRLAVLSDKEFARGKIAADKRSFTIQDPAPLTVTLLAPPNAVLEAKGIAGIPNEHGHVAFELEYSTRLPVDQFLLDTPVPPVPDLKPETLQVVPGFIAHRLALTDEVMPTAITWRPDGTLVVASLKGQVWQAQDTDRDGMADLLLPISDELAAPYGLFATNEYVDVANKYAVVRLHDDNHDGDVDRTVTIASGWGHTADYHDWAVGLPRDDSGNYYVALPCQQDERSAAAARLRGEFLKLVPRQPTADDPRLFTLQTISRGHRFPMGIARRRDGELFVSDNQGNYNPFNEINHVQPGAHFGFINAIEKGSNNRPPLTSPAVNLPHPWVRSVNGICFLETPEEMRSKSSAPAFGPFEGHIIGCEYDTRRLVRMSLQKVGDLYQGAAYPFSYDQPTSGPPLLGPLVCEVAPSGDLYVGGIRDSGWGGANNVGEVVRLQFRPDQLPCGIAEMRAVPNGFEIEFTSEVDTTIAKVVSNYSLASYTRESTPAYGGPDLDRRTESIEEVTVSDDARRVTLRVPELRPGYVYELHVKKLVTGENEFFPAEAHFTLLATGPSAEN